MSARFEERTMGVWDRQLHAQVHPNTPQWREYQAYMAATGEEPDPQPAAPEAVQFAAALAEKIANLENLAGEMRRAVTGRATAGEMASWTMKADEAKAFIASGNPSDAPLLAAEAAARGVTLTEIATRVHANSVAYVSEEGFIAGVTGKHKDALKQLTSVAEVLAYDISAGWQR